MTSEDVPRPVHESRPMKTSDPTPAATRPGTSTSAMVGPARPEPSISRNAASNGEPNSALMALKLPAAAITASALGGASRAARRTAQTPSPPPSAMRGASGPMTAPRQRPASAAKKMLGSSMGDGAPRPGWNPSAGDSPPLPGRCWMVSPTSRPASASRGSGHHVGTLSNPRSSGRSVKSQSCASSTTQRKPQAAAAIGAPMIAASTRSFR